MNLSSPKREGQSVETPIGFSDGEVTRIEKLGDFLQVIVRAWNGSNLRVEFRDVIGFRESLSFELSDLVQSTANGDFFRWCIDRAYEDGRHRGESLYQFLGVDSQPCLEVVAKSVSVRLE